MNKHQILTAVALIVTGIAPTGTPNGHLYAVAMQAMTLAQYNDVLGLCIGSGLVEKSGEVLSLTEKGRTLAVEVRVAVKPPIKPGCGHCGRPEDTCGDCSW